MMEATEMNPGQPTTVLLDPLLQEDPPVSWEQLEDRCRRSGLVLRLGPFNRVGIREVHCRWRIPGTTHKTHQESGMGGRYRFPAEAFLDMIIPIVAEFLMVRSSWILKKSVLMGMEYGERLARGEE